MSSRLTPRRGKPGAIRRQRAPASSERYRSPLAVPRYSRRESRGSAASERTSPPVGPTGTHVCAAEFVGAKDSRRAASTTEARRVIGTIGSLVSVNAKSRGTKDFSCKFHSGGRECRPGRARGRERGRGRG